MTNKILQKLTIILSTALLSSNQSQQRTILVQVCMRETQRRCQTTLITSGLQIQTTLTKLPFQTTLTRLTFQITLTSPRPQRPLQS